MGLCRRWGVTTSRDLASALAAPQTIGRTERVFTAKLVPEPENPFDSNALAVVTEGDAKIGCLSREVAKSYQKHLMRQPPLVTCPAKLVGGHDGKRSIVVLDFETVQPLKGNLGA